MHKANIVTELDLQKAIERVRRERMKAKDDDTWADFCMKEIKQYKAQPKCVLQDDFDYCDYAYKNKNIHNDEVSKSYDSVGKNVEDFAPNRDYDQVYDLDKCKNKKKTLVFSKLTMVSLPNADDTISLEKQFNFEKEKLNGFLIKIKQILEIIRFHLYDFKIPDTPAEAIQLQRKALDFCIRFSRNHYYQIELQTNNIMQFKNKLTKTPTLQMEYDFLKLLVKYYQILFHAYNMFQRHMYIIWGYDGTVEKLCDLVRNTADSCETFHSIANFMSSSLCADLLNICIRVLEGMKNLKNVKDPNDHQKVIKTRRIVSADITKPKSSYKLRSKSATPSRMKVPLRSLLHEVNGNVQQNKKKNDQYSMYKERPFNKIDKYCKQCVMDLKNRPNLNSRFSSVVSKNYTNSSHSNKIGQGFYHKDCHSSSFFFKKSKDAIKNTKTDKENKIEILGISPESELLNINSNNGKSIKLDNNKKNVKTLLKDVSNVDINKNVKIISMKHDDTLSNENVNEVKVDKETHLSRVGERLIQEVAYSHSDTEIYKKPDKLKTLKISKQISLDNASPIYKTDNERKTASSEFKKSPRYFRSVDKIDRISDDLINNELQMLEKDMDLPIDQFIKSEVEAFSKFLYKTNITKT